MVRVTGVANAREVVIERNGKPETIPLAGVEVVDDTASRAMLQWTLVGAWVSLEKAEGGYLLYRSPDALFVNRELVTRGFARATLPEISPQQHVVVTYLGTINPAPRTAALPKAPKRTAPARGTGSGKSPRPPKPRSPRGRR